MILTTLMAASLLLSPPQSTRTEGRAAVEKQAQQITMVFLLCRPVLAPNLWDAWLPLAESLGVTPEEIARMREINENQPPFPVTNALCIDTLVEESEKLDLLMEVGK